MADDKERELDDLPMSSEARLDSASKSEVKRGFASLRGTKRSTYHLDQIRTQAKKFSNNRLSRQSGVARSAIMNFKRGRNTIKPGTLRKLIKAIHSLQNKRVKN